MRDVILLGRLPGALLTQVANRDEVAILNFHQAGQMYAVGDSARANHTDLNLVAHISVSSYLVQIDFLCRGGISGLKRRAVKPRIVLGDIIKPDGLSAVLL